MIRKKSILLTESGRLRLRWWPLLALVGWIAYNGLVLLMVMLDADGVAHRLWNAPLFWLFPQY